MKHKKKPVLFYTSNLIIYIVLFILLLFTSSFIYDIQFSTPDLRITKLIKDIYLGAFCRIMKFPVVDLYWNLLLHTE